MSKWPNFFIVGAPRSGTTSLYEYLKDVQSIFMSPVKEPNFFNPNINDKLFLSKPIRDEKKYLGLFNDIKNEIAIGESSPTYLWDKDAPKLIHTKVPHAKIIIMLRNPIERAYSEFLFLTGLGSEKDPFSKNIRIAASSEDYEKNRILTNGLYYEQVNRYCEIFEKEKVMVVVFEKFAKDTWNEVKRILEFLDVRDDPPESVNQIYNQFMLPKNALSKIVIGNPFLRKIGKSVLSLENLRSMRDSLTKKTKKPQMLTEDRKFLEDFYSDDVKKLEEWLSIKFTWF